MARYLTTDEVLAQRGRTLDVGDIIAYENGELSDLQTLELFGHLIRTGQAWSLQGSYGRQAQSFIDNDLLDPETGNITDWAVSLLADADEED